MKAWRRDLTRKPDIYCQHHQYIVNGLETTTRYFMNNPSNNVHKFPVTATVHHFTYSLKHQIFICQSTLCVWEKERLRSGRVITVIVGLCCFFGCCFSGLLYWVVASTHGTCCCALQLWSDLPDRWLGDIKSLLSAGAGPGSGGWDGWMEGGGMAVLWPAIDWLGDVDGCGWQQSEKCPKLSAIYKDHSQDLKISILVLLQLHMV